MKRILIGVVLLGLGSTSTAQQGDWIQRAQRVSDTRGNFGGVLDDGDVFGIDSAGLGDLDGDGLLEVAVGSQFDDDGGTDRGAVWILSLNPDGTVAAESKIAQGQGGFGGVLADGDAFGHALARLDDLDGNGVADLAVSSLFDADGGAARGAVWILFLSSTGSVVAQQKISSTAGGFAGALDDGDVFGISLDSPGDLDGDGLADLVVGAHGDDDGGADRGAVWFLFLNQDGTVKGERKISQTAGAFTGTLADGDQFGDGVTWLGDLDGDGVGDLAVGAHGSDDTGNMSGALWILFLRADQTVRGVQKISGASGGFGGTLDAEDLFGLVMGTVGDLDGDGRAELGVGAVLDDDGGNDRGAFWILFLEQDGTVRDEEKISDLAGGFGGTLRNDDHFGRPRLVGDLNADGVDDLVVGATGTDDGGSNRGAVWVLQLSACQPAQLAVRNGAGVNAMSLLSLAAPVTGADWTAELDASGHANGLALLVCRAGTSAGSFLAAGELLVDLGSPRLLRRMSPHTGGVSSFALSVPVEMSLCGLEASFQGLVFGAPGPALSNALDVRIGP